MKPERAIGRLTHIKTAIGDIHDILDGRSLGVVRTERATQAAFERFLEIISEASRHVPDDWKSAYPAIPWHDIANIGNRIRHAYDKVDVRVLWNIYEFDLNALEKVVDELIDAHRDETDV